MMITRSTGIRRVALLMFCVFGCGVLPSANATGPVAVASGESAEASSAKPASLVQFTLSAGAGYLSGESTELVYWPWENNHKASELTWKTDALFMVGLGGILQIGNRFAVNFDGWFKATDGEGSMDDYDWQVPGLDWTDWSRHEETDVTNGSIIDLNANYSFFRSQNVVFKVIAGLKRDEFGWEARGGDFVYSIGGFRNFGGSFADGLPVISYEQTMTSLYAGLGLCLAYEKFQVDARVIYSPLVDGETVDNHYLRNLVVTNNFEDGEMLAFDIAGTYWF
ncbi:MAG: omptin family outer membrane protease, partial [Desulforhopalus sp.]|nr:omptin family outer membrane protease [Desulforhopalus sp.]